MSLINKEEYNQYHKEYQLKRYHQRRAAAIAYLGGECVVCYSQENLQIDHINPKNKQYSISRIMSYSNSKFLKELNKCQLLCSIHHLEKSKCEGSFRRGGGGHNKITEYLHGTGHMYNKDKCRCIQCKKWKKMYRAKQVNYLGLPRN